MAWVGLVGLRAQPAERVRGRTELGLALRRINNAGTFMMATAHPDDENNGVLALLSKGEGIRTTLVTATRGDGGQNEIGPELSDALAALRTEELLAAHRLDGAEQYFTRAVDFATPSVGKRRSRSGVARRSWATRADDPDHPAGRHRGMSPDGDGGGQHHQASAVLAHEAYAGRAPTRTGFRSSLPRGSGPGRRASSISAQVRPWRSWRAERLRR